jgi:lysyl-tRNA synthetase class 1
MSSSKGVGSSAKDMADVTTPETLRFLMIKTRPETAVDFDPEGRTLLRIFDDYDLHESVYFGERDVKDEKDKNNMKRSYELSQVSDAPDKSSVHVPSNTVLDIIKIMPESNRFEFFLKKLKDMGYVKKENKEILDNLKMKLSVFEKLVTHFSQEQGSKKADLNKNQKELVEKIIGVIESSNTGEDLQNGIFEEAKSSDMKMPDFFKMIYQILLGSDRGPKLGPYILERGKEEVIRKLREAI